MKESLRNVEGIQKNSKGRREKEKVMKHLVCELNYYR